MTISQRIPRTRDADATRSRVLDAAAALFAQKGFDGVRLREIAERANATVPLLCHHFKDKDTLYQAVIDRAIEAFAQLGWDVLHHAGPFEHQLEGLVNGLIDFFAADPITTQLIHRELASGGERAKPIAERWIRPLKEASSQAVRAAQRRGEVRRDLDPDLLVLHVVGAAIYPSMAAPIVEAVWGSDPAKDPLLRARKRALLGLLRPLVLRSTARRAEVAQSR